ncbi:rhodanese-like domain-containing protein [Dyella sp.]|uniref:rhodanese-like domain-containing protein n=1 Tax=Dyella sp. TaxID=1869338 RepID=UPI002ED581A9
MNTQCIPPTALRKTSSAFLVASVWLIGLAASLSAGAAEPLPARQFLSDQQQGHAPLLVDVRHPDEYRDGHIAGALNIPVEQLAARHGVLDVPRDSDIVVYCKSGIRAAKAQALLQSIGYSHVRVLEGSVQGWQRQHLPLVRETGARKSAPDR